MIYQQQRDAYPGVKHTIMLFKALEDKIGEQIWDEFCSAHLCLSMSAYCEAKPLPGFARWVPMQAQRLE